MNDKLYQSFIQWENTDPTTFLDSFIDVSFNTFWVVFSFKLIVKHFAKKYPSHVIVLTLFFFPTALSEVIPARVLLRASGHGLHLRDRRQGRQQTRAREDTCVCPQV